MPQRFWDFVLRSHETKLEPFVPVDHRYVWRRKNEAYAEKNNLLTVKHGGGLVMLWGCFASSENLEGTSGRQDGFIEVSGNPGRKRHAVCEEAEAWATLDLPTGQ